MDCPQWTAMSQHPASLPTTLPPKCLPTWGTAPPPRPMWPDPHGSRPVAVLYLPTAVTSPPLWPSRAWTATPSTRSPPRRCESQLHRLMGERRRRGGGRQWGHFFSFLLFLWRTRPPGPIFVPLCVWPPPRPPRPPRPLRPAHTQTKRHERNKQSVKFFFF